MPEILLMKDKRYHFRHSVIAFHSIFIFIFIPLLNSFYFEYNVKGFIDGSTDCNCG
jgi:hypothetical protein